eukprot:3314262-Prymnesium_polylepis.1
MSGRTATTHVEAACSQHDHVHTHCERTGGPFAFGPRQSTCGLRTRERSTRLACGRDTASQYAECARGDRSLGANVTYSSAQPPYTDCNRTFTQIAIES